MVEEESRWLKVFRKEEERLGNAGSRVHHWWPKGLQREWRVHGDIKQWPKTSTPRKRKYGAETGAHDIVVFTAGGKKRFVYEGVFRDVDNSIRDIARELRRIFSSRSIWKDILRILWKVHAARLCRLPVSAPNVLPELSLDKSTALGLARIACSVSIRSPGNRRKLEAGEWFWDGGKAMMVGANVVQQWRLAEKAFDSCPVLLEMIFIRTYQGAFVFPDAFPQINLIDNKGIGTPATSRLLFPVLPDLCMVGKVRVASRETTVKCWTFGADKRRTRDINAYLSATSAEYLYGLDGTDYCTGNAEAGKAFLDGLWRAIG